MIGKPWGCLVVHTLGRLAGFLEDTSPSLAWTMSERKALNAACWQQEGTW